MLRKLILAPGYFFERLKGGGIGATLVRGAGSAFIIKVLGVGLGFAVQVTLARLLGAKSFGDYSYAFAWMNLLLVLGKMGFDTASLRFISVYKGQTEWGLLRGFLQRSSQITAVASVTVAVVAACVVWLLKDKLGADLASVFWVSFLILPIGVLLLIRSSALRALKEVVSSQTTQFVLRPFNLLIGIGLVYLFANDHLNAPVAMAVNLVGTLIALVIASFFLSYALPVGIRTVKASFQSREWARVSMTLLLVSGFGLILHQIDIILVGFFLGTTKAGIYSVTTRIVALVAFGLTAVNVIVAPMISDLYARNKLKELQRIITLAAIGIFIFTLPASLGIIVWGKSVLFIFGEVFTEGYTALIILIFGQMINALAGSVGFIMSMTGHHREMAYVMGGCALLNFILNVILIPTYGIKGAAIATAITTAMWNIILIVYIKKTLKLNTTLITFGVNRS